MKGLPYLMLVVLLAYKAQCGHLQVSVNDLAKPSISFH